MKSERGVTLVSLIIYIMVMIIVIAIMSQIINRFYSNTQELNSDTESVLEFNKFNSYFLKEIKQRDNELDSIINNSILFTSGNTFSKQGNHIYYNNIPICSNVKSFIATEDEHDNTIINISIEFENFSKSINYKIEDLY